MHRIASGREPYEESVSRMNALRIPQARAARHHIVILKHRTARLAICKFRSASTKGT